MEEAIAWRGCHYFINFKAYLCSSFSLFLKCYRMNPREHHFRDALSEGLKGLHRTQKYVIQAEKSKTQLTNFLLEIIPSRASSTAISCG
jgi:hypothetical protein